MTNENKRGTFPPYLPILILSLLLVVLVSCVLSPLYMQIKSDVILMYSIVPIIIEYLIILLESFYIALLFAVVSCSIYSYHKGNDKSKTPFMLTIILVFFKHILNLAISSIVDSYIDLSFDIPVTLISAIIDILQIAAVALIANTKCKKHFAYAKKMQKASKYLDAVEYDETSEIYPFGSMLNVRNSILLPLFFGALISASILLLQRIYADIIVLGSLQTSFELLDLILSYSSDILMGILVYIAAYFSASYIMINLIPSETN